MESAVDVSSRTKPPMGAINMRKGGTALGVFGERFGSKWNRNGLHAAAEKLPSRSEYQKKSMGGFSILMMVAACAEER